MAPGFLPPRSDKSPLSGKTGCQLRIVNSGGSERSPEILNGEINAEQLSKNLHEKVVKTGDLEMIQLG